MKKLQLLNLAEFGAVLSSRATGREAADRVQDVSSHGGLVVNFQDVEIATPSFLDEVVMRSSQLLRGKDLILVITGLDSEVRESLEMVLEYRDMQLAYLDNKQIKLLGGSKQLNETLSAAQKLGSFKAPELADQLKLKLPNLHQRLSSLLETGALTRESDAGATKGPGHDYFTPTPEDVNPDKLVAA
jgi:hypothetical protein